MVLSQEQHQNVLQLEKQLRKTLGKRSLFSDEVCQCCQALRVAYENLIISNHHLAQTVDTHQSLWKNVFYRCIEEYRNRIRKYLNLVRQVGDDDHGEAEEQMRQTTASFRSFLSEATGFYNRLVQRLRSEFGETEVSNYKISCHRCLIYLGDIARYSAQYTEGVSNKKDWSNAAAYYLQASALLPTSGNPHNQLAVLATYMENHLLALYRYFRSLAVPTPFVTAQENVNMLFRKSHQRYAQLLLSADNTPTTPSQPRCWKRVSIRIVEALALTHTQPRSKNLDDIIHELEQDMAELVSCGKGSIAALLVPDTTAVGSGRASPLLQVLVVIISLADTWTKRVDASQDASERFECVYTGEIFIEILMVFLIPLLETLEASWQEDAVSIPKALALVMVMLEWYATSLYESEESCLCLLMTRTRQTQSEGRSWQRFWQLVCSLLSKLEPLVEGGGSMAQAAAYACTEVVNSPAVQEDYELCGFTPLHTKHSMLHFNDHHLTDPGSNIPADQSGRNETAQRVTRIFASAYEIATYPDPLHNLPPIQLNPNTGVFTVAKREFTAATMHRGPRADTGGGHASERKDVCVTLETMLSETSSDASLLQELQEPTEPSLPTGARCNMQRRGSLSARVEGAERYPERRGSQSARELAAVCNTQRRRSVLTCARVASQSGARGAEGREKQALEEMLLTATASAPGAEGLRVAGFSSLEERVPDQRMHWKSFRKQQGQQLQAEKEQAPVSRKRSSEHVQPVKPESNSDLGSEGGPEVGNVAARQTNQASMEAISTSSASDSGSDEEDEEEEEVIVWKPLLPSPPPLEAHSLPPSLPPVEAHSGVGERGGAGADALRTPPPSSLVGAMADQYALPHMQGLQFTGLGGGTSSACQADSGGDPQVNIQRMLSNSLYSSSLFETTRGQPSSMDFSASPPSSIENSAAVDPSNVSKGAGVWSQLLTTGFLEHGFQSEVSEHGEALDASDPSSRRISAAQVATQIAASSNGTFESFEQPEADSKERFDFSWHEAFRPGATFLQGASADHKRRSLDRPALPPGRLSNTSNSRSENIIYKDEWTSNPWA